MIGQVLSQAISGIGAIDTKTGASSKASDMISRTTGTSPADLIARAKTLAANNPTATGAAIGTLATVLLGTGGGRKILGTGAQLGGLALIGGLAYQAFQNYQAGKPLLGASEASPPLALPAPEAQDRALRLTRAMIAAASADGIIDDAERAAILGNLGASGLEADAAAFIDQEFRSPATIAELAQGVSGPEEAAQIYAAARLAIDPDTRLEAKFLHELALALALDPKLVDELDAAAEGAKTPA
jgi:uncharacterized membrane protein YebE (DUF533 family)